MTRELDTHIFIGNTFHVQTVLKLWELTHFATCLSRLQLKVAFDEVLALNIFLTLFKRITETLCIGSRLFEFILLIDLRQTVIDFV